MIPNRASPTGLAFVFMRSDRLSERPFEVFKTANVSGLRLHVHSEYCFINVIYSKYNFTYT